METPVAFIVFNRPEVTRQVFARIRAARPPRLFAICDGPRPHRPDDAAKVAAVREIIDRGVDWPCEVIRDYAAANLGCRRRVVSGLDHVFAQAEEAIILEDDCLPDPSFFGFCSELLARHRDNPRIMHIGGTNLADGRIRTDASYWVSRHAWMWGWATWRRAWARYDPLMATWGERKAVLDRTFASAWERQFWFANWAQFRADPASIDTWDFPWMYTVRSLDGVCLLPRANLVENLGFGGDATHTGAEAARLRTPASPSGAIRHPSRLEPVPLHDELFSRVYANDPFDWRSGLRSRLRILRRRFQLHR